MIRMNAWLMRSLLTTAPIDVRLRCSAIGPSSSWSAVATAPISPAVGICVLPVTGGADGEALGTVNRSGAEALGAGLALALGAGDPLGAPSRGGR